MQIVTYLFLCVAMVGIGIDSYQKRYLCPHKSSVSHGKENTYSLASNRQDTRFCA